MNKLMLRHIFSSVCFFCIAINAIAQDTIIKKDNEVIKAKIVEIGTSEIKYKYFDAPDGPTIVISKDDIKILKIKGQDDKMMNVINNTAPAPDNTPPPDIIIKKNGEQIKVRIVEVGPNEVKFKYYDAPNGPVIVMEKRDIKTMKVKGKADKSYDVISNEPDPMSVGNSAILDKTSSLKFNFFSPLKHHLAFSYEWMIRPGFNWETGLGIVGPGVGLTDRFLNEHPKGVFIRTGPKFLLGSSSDIEIQGARYAHPLKGRYFKIEMIMYTLSKDYNTDYLNSSNYNYGATSIKVHDNYLGMALNLIYGRQFIFGNSITVGYYLGGGYGFENKETTYSSPVPVNGYNNFNDYNPTRYSHSFFGKDFPITFTGGFNVGYIFKTPEWVSRISAPRVSNKPPSRHSLEND
jgi:hypothetical protein